MISSTSGADARFLNSLRNINTRMTDVEAEVSSGKRLLEPSDDSSSVTRLLTVRARLAQLEQVDSNLTVVGTEVDASEDALSTAVNLFERVRTLAQQGANGTQTESSRTALAGEVQAALEEMIGLANTQVSGRYMFSGDSDQTAAYTWDSTADPPWGTYQGTTSTREATDPYGNTFAVALDAKTIFESSDATTNVFQVVQDVYTALVANDDDAIETALSPLAEAGDYLNSMLAYYGSVQSRMTDAESASSNLTLQLQIQLSNVEDADLTEGIVELQQLTTNQSAALQVHSAIPTTSLFDYMG